jgi:hypothetical protein
MMMHPFSGNMDRRTRFALGILRALGAVCEVAITIKGWVHGTKAIPKAATPSHC